MNTLRNAAKNFAFTLLNYRKQRGYHLMNDLKFWSKEHSIDTVFDVGANVGQTVALVKEYFPNAAIEAFEPIDSTFDLLVRNCKVYSNVNLNKMALGAKHESKVIRLNEESLTNSVLNEVSLSEECSGDINKQVIEIETIDSFCSRKRINRINLFKTDTEGFDLEVLKGAQNMLQDERIDFVLSEVNFYPEDDAQTYFCDLHTYMNEQKYNFIGLYDCLHFLGSKPRMHYCNALYGASRISLI